MSDLEREIADEKAMIAAIAARLDPQGEGRVGYLPNDAGFWALAALHDAGFTVVRRPGEDG